MANHWYAMRSKPNKEDFLAEQIDAYGIKVYYPRIHVATVNPRARKIRPFFPGYLFVQVDLEVVNLSVLNWMPGAANLVSFDGVPASVPDTLIVALRRKLEHLNLSKKALTDGLKHGESVIVQEGPFAGYEAIFDTHISGRDRVRVLLGFLQKRQVPLELRIGQIRRVKEP